MQYVTQNYKKENNQLNKSKVFKIKQTDGDRNNKKRNLPEGR